MGEKMKKSVIFKLKTLLVAAFFGFSLIGMISCDQPTETPPVENPEKAPAKDPGKNDDGSIKYKIGDIVTIDGKPQGIVFHLDEDSDGTSGKMLSIECYKAKFCGLYTKACNSTYANMLVSMSSLTDGEENWKIWSQILPDFKGSSYYDAWYWCKYTKGLEWYIPAKNEIIEINKNSEKIIETSRWLYSEGLNKRVFDKTSIWSSTPRGLVDGAATPTIALWAGDGTVSMICNEDRYYVWPARTFNKDTEGLGKLTRGNPLFYSMTLPVVNTSNKGSEFIAKIKGKNYKDSSITASDFKFTCLADPKVVENAKVTIVSDSLLLVTLSIPELMGNYEITVSSGEKSLTETLKAKRFRSYEVGSVLLSDGTTINYNQNPEFTEEQKKNSLGVIFGSDSYGVPLMLGIYNSAGKTNSNYYSWTNSGSDAWGTFYTRIQCIPSKTGEGAADTATFTGDINGNDNWTYLEAIDYAESANPATWFPAFNYVINYAKTFEIPENYATGWYMPSLAELCEIYKNKEKLNSVLEALGAVKLSQDNYWSSSQGNGYNGAWTIKMADGNIKELGKGLSKNDYWAVRTCCVRPIE